MAPLEGGLPVNGHSGEVGEVSQSSRVQLLLSLVLGGSPS